MINHQKLCVYHVQSSVKGTGGVLAKMNLASSNQEASDQVWYIQASQANQKYQGYRHYKLQDF